MSLKFIPSCIFPLFLLLLSTAVKAQTDAHVHGLATLMMALEGDVVEIQFESPAANILGFEHKAITEEEIHAAEEAEAVLESPLGLFSFAGSSCELQDMAVDLSGVMDGDHQEEHHDEHRDEHEAHDDHEDHGDEHETADAHDDHQDQDHERHDDESEHHGEHEETADAHEDHDEHKGHDQHDEEHEGHSEITANYHFTCDNVTKISSVSVALFEQFPGVEKINTMWVTEAQQGAEVLTADSTSIPLR